MWKSKRTLTAKVQPRPVRIAYLIPESASNELLDEIIDESFSRWGGRRTPLIPTDGNSVAEAYWRLLDHWDADIIYTYCDMSEQLLERLYYCLAPSEIIIHREANNLQTMTPIFGGNYRFLSSLSLLPVLDRTHQSMDAVLPEVADNDSWNNEDRDFTDSFGLITRSCLGSLVHPHARRLSIKREGACRQGHESETTYLPSVDDWINQLTQRSSVITLAALSDMRSPCFKYWADYRNGWDEHLTIVIGDSMDDRLLAWNGQHRYTNLNPFSLPILRLSQQRFEHGVPGWLKEWLLNRNHRCKGNTNTKQVKLKSCSLTENELGDIEKQIKAGYLLVSKERFSSPNVFDVKDLNSDSATWLEVTPRSDTVRFENNKLEVPMCRPSHVQPSKSTQLSNGMWAVEMTIDRAEDHSLADGRNHVWTFPRRLRLETSVEIESYAMDTESRIGLIVPPYLRPSKSGNLTIWDSSTWTRPVISLPSDQAAFCKALRELPYSHPTVRKKMHSGEANENPFFHWRVNRVGISDKGRDLLGILQFFKSLTEALVFLTNPFLCRVIKEMLPEAAEEKKKYITEISKLIKGLQSGEIESSPERIAKRALELASRSFNAQPMKIATFDFLYRVAKETTKEEHYSGNELREELGSSVTYLRNSEFLWQGFYWKCTACEHENWVSLERLTAICFCQICRTPKSSPVTGSLHFRLNPFVQHAFASTSAQGPVLWTINRLLHQAELPLQRRNSFSFAPALNVYASDGVQPWTDIDILANINGLIVMAEVKSSFSGVNAQLVDQLFSLGEKFRPNIVMLAVQSSPLGEEKNILSCLKELKTKLKALDVEFELWTETNQTNGNFFNSGVPLPLGKTMDWAGW